MAHKTYSFLPNNAFHFIVEIMNPSIHTSHLVKTREETVSILLRGGIGIMPTDTVYGLVARAEDRIAVTRMYELKSRERKPGTLIAADINQLIALGVKQSDIEKVSKWWPNPLSAVLDMSGNEYLHQGVGDIAMRVVKGPVIKAFLEKTGPLITSSANLPGQPESKDTTQAYNYFGDSVDFYVDGGVIANTVPSTIIRPDIHGITVLRQGSVHI